MLSEENWDRMSLFRVRSIVHPEDHGLTLASIIGVVRR